MTGVAGWVLSCRDRIRPDRPPGDEFVVGALITAAASSLPEQITSVAAVREGAYTPSRIRNHRRQYVGHPFHGRIRPCLHGGFDLDRREEEIEKARAALEAGLPPHSAEFSSESQSTRSLLVTRLTPHWLAAILTALLRCQTASTMPSSSTI